MGSKNIYINDYLSDNERFADLINGFLFRGKQWVKKEDLSETDTTIRKVEEETGKNPEEMFRDQLKCWNYNGKIYILGVEAEQNVHYGIPVRIMNYDAGQYNCEYKKRKRNHRHKKDLTSKEYIAGLGTEERLYPVLSMVLYLGDKTWDACSCLSELCDLRDESSELQDDIMSVYNDYKVHILDVNTWKESEGFRTDLREVLGFLYYRKDATELQKFVREHERFRHLRADAYRVIAELANISELEIEREDLEAKEEINMCEAVEKWLSDAKEEGIQEGIQEERARSKANNALFLYLANEQRYSELKRALTEDAFCEQLVAEYGM